MAGELRPVARAFASEGTDIFQKAFAFTRAAETRARGIYPYFRPISGSDGTEVDVDGKRCIMIGSNNYLGLTHDERVLEAAEAAARKYGTGCTGSRFLNGTLDLHEKLEHDLAAFLGREAALVFSTGYQTNLGSISALVGRDDVIVMDKLNHACIVDGALLSGGKLVRFRHNDMDDLAVQLAKLDPRQGTLIAVDGMFSMEGDLINLPDLVKVAEPYGARILVDEAHSLGVVGANGRGAVEHFDCMADVDMVMGTFSKSFASIGGVMASEFAVIDYLKHHARSMIFSAAMPPYAVATVQKCLEILQQEPERRERLWAIARRMKRDFQTLGFNTGHSETPVIPIIFGDSEVTFAFWRGLYDAGVFTNAVVAPAVPERSSLIRTSYMATHTDEQLDRVLETFQTTAKRLGIL